MPPVTPARRLPHWLLEGAFIVVSVLLGFAVAEYGDYRKDRELTVRVLAGLRAEIEHNLSEVEPMVPVHLKWIEAMSQANAPDTYAGKTALDVFLATRPKLPGNRSFLFLRRSAWDAAISGGALRLVDYDTSAALSEIYRVQEIASANVDRLVNGPLSQTTTVDPETRVVAVRLMLLTLGDIQSAEAVLLDLYRQHLPAIRAAAAR
jgi:hypothetical protein